MKGIVDLDLRRLSWRERRVQEWIAALPTAEPLRALGLLAQSVRALNSSVMDPATRIAILQLYEEPTMNLAMVVSSPNAEGGVLGATLHSEIAQGYQMALTPELRPELWQQAALGALSHMGEVLRAAYRNYVPAPPGLWRRIHALFRTAEPTTKAMEQAYVAILLLGLADPYALPVGGVDTVYRVIAEIGHYAVLDQAEGFAIIVGTDKPADLTATSGTFYLDAGPLLAEIARLRSALHTRKELPARLASFLLPDLADRLFLSLSEAWRPGSRRKSLRIRLSGERLVCQGLPALQRLISETPHSHNYVDLGTGDRDPNAAATRSSTALPRLTTWTVRDAGRSGLWLSVQHLAGSPPGPGTWIGIKDPQREGLWRAALVRWLKRSRPHEYAIGIQVLDDAQTETVLSAPRLHAPIARAPHAEVMGPPPRTRVAGRLVAARPFVRRGRA